MRFEAFLVGTATVSSLLLSVPSQASPIIVEGGISGEMENILFNEKGLADNELTVAGSSNKSGTLFLFSEDSTRLSTPSNGQALIEGSGGTLFDSLYVAASDPLLAFQLFQANVHVTGSSMIRVTAHGSATTFYDFLAGTGANRFSVNAVDNDFITSVLIESLGGSLIADVRQVRVGGIAPTLGFSALDPAALILVSPGTDNAGDGEATGIADEMILNPEPSAFVLLGTGLFWMVWAGRRRLMS